MDLHAAKQIIIVSASHFPRAKRFFNWFHKRRQQPARDLLQAEGMELCEAVCNSLNSAGIIAFPMFGSLLGLMREGGFIEHDDDIDIGVVFQKDLSWQDIQLAMDSLGLDHWRDFGFNGHPTEKAYKYKKCLGIDLFRLFPSDEANSNVYFYTYDNQGKAELTVKALEVPTPTICEMQSFGKFSLPIPDCADEMLRLAYGENWRVPDPGWVSGRTFKTISAKNPYSSYE